MALDSVFANPPPCAVRGNKDTFKHDDDGEKESCQNELSDHSNDEEGEGGEVEEGEIVDSEEEKTMSNLNVENEWQNQQITNKCLTDADSSQKKKKKKKKRKKKPVLGENPEGTDNKEKKAEPPVIKNNITNNNNNNKKTKKKKTNPWYVDHDKVVDDWQFKPPATTFESTEEFNSSPPNNFEARARKNNRVRKSPATPSAGKKRKASGTAGGAEKKKAKKQQFSGKGKRREIRHKTNCKFFLEGKCNKGNECTFLHEGAPARKQDLCKFYLNGFCAKGDKCLFMHSAKCYSQEKCKFSHEPLSDEMRRVLERYLDSTKEEEFHPQSPKRSKQSLLGSPPRHNDSDLRKIPSLFDIQVGTPTSTTPMPSPPDGSSPVRPNFYSETLQSPVKGRESKEGKGRSPTPDRTEEFEFPLQDVDMRKLLDVNSAIDAVAKGSDEDDDRNRLASSDSESEIKKVQGTPIAIPSHLPKKQRELFLRIQQQQREAENSQDEADRNDQKKDEEAEKEENWYSSDEDDDTEGDKPLTDVLKKLQQQPPQASAAINIPPPIDIAKMIGLLYKGGNCPPGAKPQTGTGRFSNRNLDRDMRDPRKRKTSRADPREGASFERVWSERPRKVEQRVPELHHAQQFAPDTFSRRDEDMRKGQPEPPPPPPADTNSDDSNYTLQPYKLRAMTISLPNYAHVLASTACKTDPRVLNDPRLKKENHKKAEENETKAAAIEADKFPALAQNGLSSLLGSPPKEPLMPSLPPIVLPPVEPPNPFLLSPTEMRPKQPDHWSGRSDPRLGGRNPSAPVIGRHCGLPSVRERTPYLVAKHPDEGARTKRLQQRRASAAEAQKEKSALTQTVAKEESKATGGAGAGAGAGVVDNSSLKDVFKTIDPTASPFC